jgi:PadR family transcriptional regulator PadR
METAPDRNRKFKYYRLTEKGKKQLVVEVSQWKWKPGFASPA